MHSAYRLFLIILLFFAISFNSNSQNKEWQNTSSSKQSIIEFVREKHNDYVLKKSIANFLYDSLGIKTRDEDCYGQIWELQWLWHNTPVYYITNNLKVAKTISLDSVQILEINNQEIDGYNTSVMIWDGGSANILHQEFITNGVSRITLCDNPASVSNHTTHITGTMVAGGVNLDAKGMAPAASVYSYDYNNDIAEIASEASNGNKLSNHSYGIICGWRYDSNNEIWYWHGDISVSSYEDVKFGYYDQISSDIDYILYNAPNYVLVKSAGNDRNDSPANQPVEHLVWDDNWILSTEIRAKDGGTDGYDCLSSMAVAKNVITVGAVQDLSSGYTCASDVVMEDYSSWGPTDDGRIKPDIVSDGQGVYSCSAESDSSYMIISGTSMATASISGSVLLLQQSQDLLQPQVNLLASTIKGLLIHTANECGVNRGPDYEYGWGLADIKSAVDLLTENSQNGGSNIIEGVLQNTFTKVIPITVDASTDVLKITLCWTDPEATPPDYELNPNTAMLINDLDLRLQKTSTGSWYYPWVLDPANPGDEATKGDNSRDNIEQLEILVPSAGDYEIIISHKGRLENLSQSFSLIVSGNSSIDNIFPPYNLCYSTGDNLVKIWFNTANGTDPSYNIYRNNVLIANITDTVYFDNSVINDSVYNYFVTAFYSGQDESIPTNTILAIPAEPEKIPYTEDFETSDNRWTIKNEINGWRYGDSASLSSYYLKFKNSTGYFLAADSYTAGEGIHTWDYAISPPINLNNCDSVKISFDYILVTNIYGAIDELHLVYRSTGETVWNELSEFDVSWSWKHVTVNLPSEVHGENIQFALYYDDFYESGFGAGFDNFSVTGSCNADINIDLVPVAIKQPVSQCILTTNETVSVVIQNNGTDAIPSGSVLSLSILVDNKQAILDTLLLENDFQPDATIDYTFSSGLDLSGTGTYSVSLVVKSSLDDISVNDTLSYLLNHYGYPEVYIVGLEESYCLNSDTIVLSGVPEGGVFSGEGIVNEILYLKNLTQGEKKITYTYSDQNLCSADTSYTIWFFSLPSVEFITGDFIACSADDSISIIAEPEGGELTGTAIVGNNFYPSLATIGNNPIYYSYTNINGCTSYDTIDITVNSNPEVNILTSDTALCINEGPVLINVYPTGGIFNKSGIVNSQIFPANFTPGIHQVIYTFSDEEGCTNSDTIIIIVNDTIPASIVGLEDAYCMSDSVLLPGGVPPGGVFYGYGIVDNSLYLNSLEAGEYILNYISSPGSGCSDTAYHAYKIYEVPDIILGVDTTITIEDTLVLIPETNATDFEWFNGSTDSEIMVTGSDFSERKNLVFIIVRNEWGCENSDSLWLTIEEELQSVMQETVDDGITIYPNPFSQKLNIEIVQEQKPLALKIYSLDGKVLFTRDYVEKSIYDLEFLNTGYYLLLLQFRDKVKVYSIIKE